jgi:general secretion pathway protein M
MIAALRSWYLALSKREQWLVAIAGALAGFVVMIFGVLLPAMAAIDAARAAHDEAVQRRGRIEATVEAALARKPGKLAAATTDIDLLVTQAAAEEGFEIVRNPGASPGQIGFRIDQARASALLGWLSKLESQGVEVNSITLRSGANGTVTVDTRLQGTAR